MHLIQVLLPLYDNAGDPLPRALYEQVRAELTAHFGGLTAYTRAPAEGHWGSTATIRDDIVIFEVMTDDLDREWWIAYRQTLEQRFRQEEVVIRVQEIELL